MRKIEKKIIKNKKITIIILTKNNDIYNTGIVFVCVSPCVSSVMPDEIISEHLDSLLEEKLCIVLEEKYMYLKTH